MCEQCENKITTANVKGGYYRVSKDNSILTNKEKLWNRITEIRKLFGIPMSMSIEEEGRLSNELMILELMYKYIFQ